MSGYQPGYCNIGNRQRRQRLLVAVAAFAVAALYVLAYIEELLPLPLLGGVFIPLSIGFEWGLQAYTSFCVRLALLNRYDFRGERGGDSGAIFDSSARQADHIQAVKITGTAVSLAALTTVVLAFALV